MACASGIQPWHDRLEPVSSTAVGKLVAAKAVAGVIVYSTCVRMPEINESPLDELALGRTDVALKNDSGALNARFEERLALR